MTTADIASQKPLSAEELFNSIGPAYEEAFDSQDRHKSTQWILNQVSANKPANVLDIGCGTGRPVCSTLADAGHTVLGIDVSQTMIDDARKKVPNASFDKVDILDFNVGPKTYDAVTVYFSLLCGPTQQQIRTIVRNIFTWVKPGGSLAYGTIPISGDNMNVAFLGRKFVGSSLNTEETLECIRQAGFEVVDHWEVLFVSRAVELGLCKPGETGEEPQLYVHAVKPA